jgi:hypothetical protein
MSQKISTRLGVVIIITIAITAGVFVWEAYKINPISYQSTEIKQPIKKQIVAENKIDETADWQTYRNEKYGFEVKYPTDFSIYDDYPEKNQLFVGQSEVHRAPPEGIMISEVSELAEKSIAKLKKRDELTTVVEEKNIEINNIAIKKIALTSAIGYTDAHYFFTKNSKKFEIIYENENKIQEKILSTFKLTDEIAEWQKFDYSDKGVSISIPKNWRNQSEDKEGPLFKDDNLDYQIDVSFNTDKADDNWGTPYVERLLSTAKDKAFLRGYDITGEETWFVKENLIFGKNNVYKVYHPGYLKGFEGSSYYMKLKNNGGYVEFFVSQSADKTMVENILNKVEIY